MIASPCEDCVHCTAWITNTDDWAGTQTISDCEEEAPDGVFMSEWGCFYYEKRKDVE